ncbi:hypothetical protein [Sphingobacterium hungaricum]|uniref:Uncharacterized protein n=1 Tax=Sphingobacterium hungaricum TaxID=2082723 RepID=A0A928UW19_9SPHI|nr:hypothetical protein [Sphingobacterium hungaricum]MBE8712566.1 hypothetical protein [Sphingobacterium hungaricum]
MDNNSIIKIEPQPSVASYVSKMKKGESLKFELSHTKAVREAAGRKMKHIDPKSVYTTSVDIENGFIEIKKEA